MKPKASQNAYRGSDFRDFLAGEGILPEVEVLTLKRAVSLQLLTHRGQPRKSRRRSRAEDGTALRARLMLISQPKRNNRRDSAQPTRLGMQSRTPSKNARAPKGMRSILK